MKTLFWLLLFSASTFPRALAGNWEVIEGPDYSATRDAVIDIAAGGNALYLLTSSRIPPSTADLYHVVRRANGGWQDLGLPDASAFIYGLPQWKTIAVAPNGDLWLGGVVETIGVVNRGYAQPVFSRYRGDSWSAPVVAALQPVVEYPYTQRGGIPYDISFAADGSGFAVGESGGWGGFSGQTQNPMWLKLGADGSWNELNVADRPWPIPGRSFLYHRSVLAFDESHAQSFAGTGGAAGSGLGMLWNGSSPLVELDTPADFDQAGHFIVRDSAANGPNDIWVVGEGHAVNPDGTPFSVALGLMHYDGSGWTVHPGPLDGVSIPTCRAVVMESDGTAWASYDGQVPSRIFRYDGSDWSIQDFVPVSAPEERFTVTEMIRDDDGTVWAVGMQSIGPVPNIFLNEPDTRVHHAFVAKLTMPAFAIQTAEIAGEMVTLAWQCAGGFTYTVEESTALDSGFAGKNGFKDMSPPPGGTTMTATFSRSDGGRCFWRIARRPAP